MKVIIAGWTAAGKTTHARLLAKHLGWQYLGMSTIIGSLLDRASTDPEWSDSVDAARANQGGAIDLRADELMTKAINASSQPVVVDSWIQPWLHTDETALRVWIESDLPSRVLKAQVSYLRAGATIPSDVSTIVERKDLFSVDMFRRLYSIDYEYDSSLFEVAVSNSQYISSASIFESNRGIEGFSPVLHAAIEQRLNERSWL